MDQLLVPAVRTLDGGTIRQSDLDGAMAVKLAQDRPELTCASCGGETLFVNATRRVKHFRHVDGFGCAWGPESGVHLAVKDYVASRLSAAAGWMAGEDEKVAVRVEVADQEGVWRADVHCVVTRRDGVQRRLVVEVQQSPQSPAETLRRTLQRQQSGFDVLWVHLPAGDAPAPSWLVDVAPTVVLRRTELGGLTVEQGVLEHHLYTADEVPWERDQRLGPRAGSEVVIDSFEIAADFALDVARPWIDSDGMLTDPVADRDGLVWVEAPPQAGDWMGRRVLVDTRLAWEWQQAQRRQRERQERDTELEAARWEAAAAAVEVERLRRKTDDTAGSALALRAAAQASQAARARGEADRLKGHVSRLEIQIGELERHVEAEQAVQWELATELVALGRLAGLGDPTSSDHR